MNHSSKIFISYRRDDTGGDAGRLNDTLNQLLGSGTTFLDLEQIAPGKNFEAALDDALEQCKFLLALIGPHWETIANPSGHIRLGEEGDFVHREVLAAMQNPTVQVVPVLVNRYSIPDAATLPEALRPLTQLQAFPIRRDRWKEDTSTLLQRLGIPLDPEEDRQARLVSAVVEWKRKDQPDITPRRWVLYIDNHSDAPIFVEYVTVRSELTEQPWDEWGPVGPHEPSDYELDETDFPPEADTPRVSVRFTDAHGRRWSLRRGILKRLAPTAKRKQ